MYPEAYIQFLVQFHGSRDFFECHDILEEHWKEKEREKRDIYWTGLIQLAAALYHHRRGNWKGAEKLLQSSYNILASERTQIEALAVDTEQLFLDIAKRLEDVKKRAPYIDMNLPLTDADLVKECQDRCIKQRTPWRSKSDMNNLRIIHRHILRHTSVSKEHLIKKLEKEKQHQNTFQCF